MRKLVLVTLLVGTFVGACRSSEDAAALARQRCQQFRDHLIDLRLRGETDDVAAHRRAMKQALGDRFIDRCVKLPPAQVKCGLASTDLRAVGGCGVQK